MNDVKRENLKRNVVDQVEKVVDDYKPFEAVIDIYVGMLLQKENLESRIKDNKNNMIKLFLLSLKAESRITKIILSCSRHSRN